MPIRAVSGKVGYSWEGGERRRREKMPVPEPGSRIVRPEEELGDVEVRAWWTVWSVVGG